MNFEKIHCRENIRIIFDKGISQFAYHNSGTYSSDHPCSFYVGWYGYSKHTATIIILNGLYSFMRQIIKSIPFKEQNSIKTLSVNSSVMQMIDIVSG